MAIKQSTQTVTVNGNYDYVAASNGYKGIRVRSGPGTGYTELGKFPDYSSTSEIINVEVKEISNGWIHQLGSTKWGVPAGWCAIVSGDITYFVKVEDPYSYPETVYSGYADADYYWPNTGSSSYSYQTYERRYNPDFYLHDSPGSNVIANTKSNIVLTINYNNNSTNDSQTGQTWTETTYNFSGWDRATSAPSSITAGTVDHQAGAYRSSLNDENFYAVYTKGSTSDPKYSNNTKTLSTPTKNSTSTNYTVNFDGNGGTVSLKSTTVTKEVTYKFSKWTGTSGVSVSGTTCTFTQTGTVTANYTETLTPAKVATMPTPTRPGYVFLGWGTSTSQTSNLIAAGAESPEITANITYYAIWKIDGSIRLYTNNTDKYKIAMVWMYYPTSSTDSKPWKLVIPYMKTDVNWKITAG